MCRRVLRCLCICCCRCCCVKPAPYPEEILGTTRQAIIKAIIVLLGLGVCACCAYGMSQIDPQLVSKGLNVINNLKVCCISSELHSLSSHPIGHLWAHTIFAFGRVMHMPVQYIPPLTRTLPLLTPYIPCFTMQILAPLQIGISMDPQW